MSTLGARIKKARTRKKLSQGALGKLCGHVTREAVSQWESDSTKPSHEHLEQIATATDADLALLLRGDKKSLARAVSRLVGPTRRLSLGEFGLNAAAGGGAVVEAEEIVAHWDLPEVWLRTLTSASERDLHVITVEGNSMEPELYAGDKVIVDSTRKSPTPPGIFVLNDGIGLVVKQLEHIPKTDPPRVEIKSANKDYRADEATAEEINIIGRVIGVIRRV